jgi:hypothetical protein
MNCYAFESIKAFVHGRLGTLFLEARTSPVASPERRML